MIWFLLFEFIGILHDLIAAMILQQVEYRVFIIPQVEDRVVRKV